MIVRVNFEGTITEGKKKSVLPDFLDIHVPTGALDMAKEIFTSWLNTSAGVKGNSGVFHPLGNFGQIKIKKVEESHA